MYNFDKMIVAIKLIIKSFCSWGFMGNKIGVIDISRLNNPPEKHELATAKYFSEMGKDVVFICPSSIPGAYRPDIIMDGVEWEIKSPIGKGKKTIERNMHKAAMQSQYIIFDLRRINLNEKQCISQLEQEFYERKYLKELLIIKKNDELITFSRR